MADLKILLTADLNVKKTTDDINLAIAKIQEKITKLQLKIDTKALKDAGILIKGLNESATNVQKGVAQAAKATKIEIDRNSQKISKQRNDLKEFQLAMNRVNDEIGKTTPKKYNVTKDADGQIKRATVTYSNEMGRTIQKNFEWVSKTVGDTTTKTFKQVSQNIVESTGKATKKMQALYNEAGKMKFNLSSGKTTVFDAKENKKLIDSYTGIQTMLSSAQKNGNALSLKTLEGIDKEIQKNKELTNEIVRQQKAKIKNANLGRDVIGNAGGLNFATTSNSKLISNALPQLNSYMANQGLGGKATASNFNVDSIKMNDAGKAVATLSAKVEVAKGKFASFKIKVDEASNSTRVFGQRLNDASKANLSFMDQLKTAMSRIPIWMVGMTLFYQSLHFFTDGVAYVNEFNKSLTELSIVFNQSQGTVSKYAEQFHNLGMEMSIATQEVAKGAVEFARQGLTGADMMDKMRVATMYAKISNMDFTQSAQILTATVNSMGVSAEHAADIYSYMGDATATGADEIGRAMQKVGGTAGAIGLEFEKVSSWIATISSRTRESAETIGSSVKSIMARVQSMKEKGFDSEDGTEVNQVAKALDRVGIKLMDVQGNFRNFGDVMDELGAKWGSLTNRQQAYIATTVAGSYQQSRFLNIMEGYPESVKLYEESLNKAGTATEKFNRYQEGTEAHMTRMKNAWNNIFQSSFDSEGIRILIDALTGLGTSIDNVIKTIGILPIIIGVATGALIIFNKTAYASFGSKLVSMILHPIAAFNSLYNSIGKVTVGLVVQAQATSKAAVAMNLFKAGLLGVSRAIAPLALFMGVAWGIQKITESVIKHNAEVKEMKTVNYELRDSYLDQKKGIQDLLKEYNELKNTEDKTIEQKNRLLAIQNELVSQYGVSATGIDAEGNAYVNSNSVIQDRINSLNELIDTQNKLNKAKVLANFTDNAKDIKSKRTEYEKNSSALKDLEAQEKAYLSGERKTQTLKVEMGDGNIQTIEVDTDIEKLNEQKAKIMTAMEKSKSELDALTGDKINAIKNEYNERLETAGKSVTNEQREFADSLSKIIGEMDYKVFDDQVTFLEDSLKRFESVGIDSTEKLKAYFAGNNIEFNTKNVDLLSGMINELSASMDNSYTDAEAQSQLYHHFGQTMDMTKTAVLGVVEAFRHGKPVIEDDTVAMEDALSTTEDYAKSLKTLQDSYSESSDILSTLNGFLKDNAEGKQISADSVMDLIAKDKSLVSLFKIENGVIKLNKNAVEDKRKSMIKSLRDEGTAQRNALMVQNQVLVDKLKAYGIELDAVTNVGEAIDLITSKTENLTYMARRMGEEALIPGLNSTKEEMIAIVQAMADLKAQAELGAAALGSLGDESSDTKDTITALQRAINAVDAALAKVESKQDRYAKSSKQYRAAVQEEINLLNKKKKLLLEGQADPSKLVSKTTTTTSSGGSGGDTAPYTGGTGVKATGNLKDMIIKTATNAGIDASIFDALVFAESSYKPNLTSSAGAAGLTQLMPGTARSLGVSNVFDPQQNLTGGAKYLDQMFKKYGSYELALAAYNAGPGYVDWAIKTTGSKDWNVIKNAKADKAKLRRKVGDNIFKKETQNYVPKIMKYAQSGNGVKAPDQTVVSGGNSTSTSSSVTTTTTQSSTSKDIEAAIKSAEDGLVDVDNKLYAATRDMLDSYIAQFDMGLESKDKAIGDSQYRAARVDPSSKAYEKESESQIAQLKVKQKLMKEEAQLIRNSGISSDDLTQKVTSLGVAWQEAQDQIDALNNSLADQSVNKFEKAIESTNHELAMSAGRLSTYDEQSKEYRSEVLKSIQLNEKLQKQTEDEAIKIRAILKDNETSHKLTLEKVEEYNQRLAELKVGWWEIAGTIKVAKDSLKKMNEDIATKAVDLLKNMYEKQKDAIIKSIDEQDDALEKAHKKEMDRIDEKLKADQKVIDSRIKQLEFDKSESEYLTDLNKKTKARQELQDKINRLSMDDSKEAKAQLKDLIKQRDDADEEIAKLKDDHALEAQKTDLEKQKETLEEKAEADKKSWSQSVEIWDANSQQMVTITGKSYDDMKEIIEEYKNNAQKYFQDIADDEKRWSDMRKNIEKGNIGEIQTELNKLKGWFDTNLPIVGQSIYDSITTNLEEVISKLKIIRSESDAISEMQANSAKWKTATAEEKKALEKANEEIGGSIGAVYDPKTGTWYDSNAKPLYGNSGTTGNATSNANSSTIAKMKANAAEWKTAKKARQTELEKLNNDLGKSIGLSKKADGHWYDKNGAQVLHTGGIVGDEAKADPKTKLMNEFLNTNANERVIKALEGELMSPSQNVTSKIIPNINKLVSRLLPTVNVASSGGNTVNINIANVNGTKAEAESVAGKIMSGMRKLGWK